MTKENKLEDIPFEKALNKLESIVSKIEGENRGLDKTLKDFEEGMKLAQLCEEKLSAASGKVEKIMKEFGKASKVPFKGANDEF